MCCSYSICIVPPPPPPPPVPLPPLAHLFSLDPVDAHVHGLLGLPDHLLGPLQRIALISLLALGLLQETLLPLFTYGWIEDGWVDGWMHGWMGEWMDGWMDGRVDGWMGGRVDGWMDGWVDGWTGGWMDGWTGGWMQACFFDVIKECSCVHEPTHL